MEHLVARLMATWLKLQKDGQALVEYALLLALIAIVCIAMITLVGSEANSVFNIIAQSLVQAIAGAA
jgi:pilus assembly protein Flp/PilA